MGLDTLQQRIHRARTEVELDTLYSEAGVFYNNGDLAYNFALGLLRELNKRFWLSFRTDPDNYPFFSVSDGVSWDSNILTFDSDLITFDQT